MICENGYELKLASGEVKTFNTDLELDAYIDELLRANPNAVDISTFVTRAVNFQKETVEILDEISEKVSSVSELVSYHASEDPEDIIEFYKIKNSIGVTRFLQTNEVPSTGDPFGVPFNEDSWRINRLATLKAEGFSEKNAIDTVTLEMAAWKRYSQCGTEVHKIYELVFKGETCVWDPSFNTELTSDIFNDIKDQAIAFKQALLQKHGKNAKFYTEFGIFSKELTPEIKDKMSPNDSINGKIDLLVIDDFGKAHIYDFKVSRKDVGNWDTKSNTRARAEHQWDSTKKRAASLQLAFYTKLLQQYGVDVISASIVPIKTNYTYSDSTHLVGIKSFDSVEQQNTIVVPDVLSGKYALMAKEVFPTNFSINAAQIASWAEAFNKLFPSSSVKKYQENLGRDVDYYKNNPSFTRVLLPSDPMYAKGKRFAFREKGIKRGEVYATSEENLNELIGDYILALSSKRSETCVEYANRIKSVMRGEMTLDTMAEIAPIDSRAWVKSQFKRYFDEHWMFNEDDILNANGIFIFERGGICELVMLSDNPLTNVINLGMGTSILGKNTKDMNIDKTKVFEASYGHIGLMEMMVYISQNQDKFKEVKIQQVRVVNPSDTKEITALNSQLIRNYNQLKLKNPDVSLSELDTGIFVDDVKALIDGAKSRMMSIDPDLLNNIKLDETTPIEDYLDMCIETMRSTYSLYKTNRDDIDMSNEKWQAFTYLNMAKNFLHGIESHNEVNKGAYLQKGKGLTGTMISSLQFSPSANLRELGKIIDNFSSDVSKACYQEGYKMQGLFKKVYAKHGNGTDAFSHWFRRKPNGELDERLLFVDPDSQDFDGQQEDREALRELLEILNKLRFGEVNDADRQAYKASMQWFEVPLTEATGFAQTKKLGFVTAIKNKWQQFTTLTQDVFAEDEETVLEGNATRTKLYNKFELTGTARLKKIESHGVGFFDLNVERVFNQALVAFKKSEISKEYLPRISALRLALMYESSYGNQKLDDIIKTFDKAVKSKVYGESIVSSEWQPVYKWISFIRKGFTRLALSLNFTSFFRETLQGIYNGAARAGVKMLPGVNEKNYLKALQYVIKECPKNIDGVSKLQQLNMLYKMANQSMSSIAQNRRVNWLNIKNWNEDTLFLTATAPDFLHRVSILVAKMMGDGCWDAHSIDSEGRLVYDFKKDGRFQHYINGETSHEDYLKEKSLYLTMIDKLKTEGYRKEDGTELKEGDDLPQAYTQAEASTIKNFGDLLYGHYDEESKSLFCDTFIGSFVMQYKTFLTSKLEQWTMSAGVHNTDLLKQQFDPETGEELYQVITYDEENNPHRKIKRKSELTEEEVNSNNARLYYDYEGIPMNGLLWETGHFTKALLTFDQEKINEIWNNPTERGYLLLALHDQFIMGLLTLLVTFLTGEFADVDKPLDASKVRAAIRNMGPAEQLAYNVVWGSLQDSQFHNIIGNFAQSPPLWNQLSKFGVSSWQVITGKHTVPYLFTNNIGAIRNFQGLVLNAEKLAQ